MSDINYDTLEKGDKVIFVRIMPKLDIFELFDLHIVSVYEDYCTGSDEKTKQTFLFSKKYAQEVLFQDRSLALEYLDKEKQYNG